MNIAANRSLLALVLVHAVASLVHFAHNATFLADYPNMPAWLSPAGVYAVWLAQAAIARRACCCASEAGRSVWR